MYKIELNAEKSRKNSGRVLELKHKHTNIKYALS
jgi:hypothetical protein